MTRIEHVNITVPDIDEAIRFLKIVAPDFDVRKDEKPSNSYRWAHIGNEEYYFALQEPHLDADPKKRLQTYKNHGINHVALVVSNIQEIEEKLLNSGYNRGLETPVEKHRKRAYFYDNVGFEWELVEYLSENPSEKYFYE
ncbi:MAG: VOC family protein [Psychroserpens sp.]|uniref:VOC family protein n=1 Tax=Psychroserpens sp. TaxID=2020870 RepID=UPI0030010287